MATITLYKNTKLDGHKNYVIDDIETYLTDKIGYTSQNTFQYQRYELNKFIKMNLYSYFERYGLSIQEDIHCDYTRVITLKKI